MKRNKTFKRLKKLACIMLALAMILSFTACSNDDAGEEDEEESGWDWQSLPAAEKTGVTLNVFNWGEYIDDSVLDVNAAFTHVTGIDVNYRVFSDNESMYAMINSGAVNYDIIVPSDYMVSKMISEDKLEKINFENIPNFKLIDEEFVNPVYDPTNEYSVPYTWGTIGIFYNTKYVDEADLEQGWDILWDEKYKDRIFMFDNPRDAFGITLKKLGYSMNTENPDHWQEAFEELKRQKPLLQQYVMDQIFDKMVNEEGWIAPYYSGDGIIMMDEDEGNENIDYFVPEDGTNLFVDALCIPKGAKNKAEAELYINFLCQTEVALANAEYIGYSTPHTEAKSLLDPEVGENPNFYPPASVTEKAEPFLNLSRDTYKLQDLLWIKLKQA